MGEAYIFTTLEKSADFLCNMADGLQKAFEELKAEEARKKKKKKPLMSLPKEKRLMYYSGWNKP